MSKETTAMMKVTQHLWFEMDMEVALHFCTSLIPYSSVCWTSRVPGRQPQRPGRQVKLAAFKIGDQRCAAIKRGHSIPFKHSRSTAALRAPLDTSVINLSDQYNRSADFP
jgi:predicted 3-demethylubiquinone-9 3-methyltransferase (glyoxalase superfamily)